MRTSKATSIRRLLFVPGLAIGLLGCESMRLQPTVFSNTLNRPSTATSETQATAPAEGVSPRAQDGELSPGGSGQDAAREVPRDLFIPGTERFVRGRGKVSSFPTPGAELDKDITLNFEQTNLLEVIHVIMRDELQLNYQIGAGVQGTVTLQTSRPVPYSTLLPTLEMLLRANGAALVFDGQIYHVVAREQALQGGLVSPQLGDSRERLPSGYHVRIVPLSFIAAQEMHKILEPFTSQGNIVRVDTPRNLLILAGASEELTRLIETVRVFDVDWMAGMSVGMFSPDFVDAKALAEELRTVLDDDGKGPMAGLVRIVELERLNALLVITARKIYLERVATWIERLDKDPGGVGQRLFVYHVQNGRAVELAEVLTQVFESEAREALPPAELAPGLRPVRVAGAQEGEQGADNQAAARAQAVLDRANNARQREAPARRQNPSNAEGLTLATGSSLRIIADEVNNALLIKATAQEYKLVQAALRQLDIVPLQVLVEATIAEITLTDELEYGLEWYFRNHHGENRTGIAQLDLGASGIATISPGFSYSLVGLGSQAVRAVLNTLAAESRVNILSSPSLMVLNNQTATINVGDEVPVTTQQQQSTAGTSTIVNNIEFRDTGVLLTVTPRVNAGGLVTMEVEQEVSNVAAGTGNSLTPTIQQRKITSTVAVESGDTVVLGGLIRENTSISQSGIPVLHELPVVGPLFGTTGQEQRRTELVVLITPRAVQNRVSAQRITEEFKAKMKSLQPLVEPAPAAGKAPADRPPAGGAGARPGG